MQKQALRRSLKGVFVVLGCLAIPAALTAFKQPDFNGEWNLNWDRSDDPREKLREAFGPRGQRRGGFGGRRGGYGGSRGGYGGPGGGVGGPTSPGGRSRGGRGGPQGRMGGMLQPAETLTIRLNDPEFHLESSDDRVTTLFTDGRDIEQQGPGGEVLRSSTHWEGDRIVSVSETPRGGKLTRTYEVSPDSSQLLLTLRIDNSRFGKPVKIRYVYDRLKTDVVTP